MQTELEQRWMGATTQLEQQRDDLHRCHSKLEEANASQKLLLEERNTLEGNVQSMRDLLFEADEEKQGLKATIEVNESKINQLQEKSDIMEKESTLIQEELREENQKLHQDSHLIGEDIKRQNDCITELKQTNMETVQTLNTIKEEKETLQTLVLNLQKLTQQLEDELDHAAKEKVQMASEQKELRNQIAAKVQQVSEKQQEINGLENVLRQMEDQIKEAGDRILYLTTEKDLILSEKSAIMQEKDSLQVKHETLGNIKDDLEEQKAAFMEEIENSHHGTAELESKIISLYREMEVLKEQMVEIVCKNENIIKEKDNNLVQTKEKLKQELDIYCEEKANFQFEIQNLSSENAALAEKINMEVASHETSKVELEEKINIIGDHENRIKHLENANQLLDLEVQKKGDEHNDLKILYGKLCDKSESISVVKQELEIKIIRMEKQRDTLEGDNLCLKEEKERLNNVIKYLQEEKDMLLSQKIMDGNLIKDLTKEQSSLKEDLRRLQSDVSILLNGKHETALIINNLEEKKAKLEIDLEKAHLRQDKTGAEYKSQLDNLCTERDQKDIELRNLNENIVVMRQEIETICENRDSLERQNVMLKENITRTENDNRSLQEETLHLRKSQTELLLQIDKLHEDKLHCMNETQSKIDSLQSACAVLEEQCQQLERNLKECSEELESVTKERNETAEKMKLESAELEKISFEKKTMAKDHEEMILSLSTDKSHLVAINNRFQDDVNELKNAYDVLYRSHEVTKADHQCLLDKFEKLQIDKDTVLHEVIQIQQENEKLQQGIAEVNTTLASVVKDNEISVGKLSVEREEEKCLLLEEITRIQKELNAVQQEKVLLEDQKLEHGRAIDVLNAENHKLQTANGQLQNELVELDNTLEHQKHVLTAEMEILAKQLMKVQDEHNILLQEKSVNKNIIDNICRERDSIAEDLSKAQTAVYTLSNDNETLMRKIKELEATNITLHRDLDALLMQQDKATREHTVQMHELCVERDKQKLELEKFSQEMYYIKQEMDNLCETRDTLDKQKSMLEENISITEDDKNCLQKENSHLKDSQSELLLQMEELRLQKTEYMAEAQSEIGSLQNARTMLVEQCQELGDIIKQCKEENNILTKERNETTKKMDILTKEMEQITLEKTAMTTEHEMTVLNLIHTNNILTAESEKFKKDII